MSPQEVFPQQPALFPPLGKPPPVALYFPSLIPELSICNHEENHTKLLLAAGMPVLAAFLSGCAPSVTQTK